MTSPSSLEAELIEILETSTGDGSALEQLYVFFDGMSEADRRSLAKPARRIDDERQTALNDASSAERGSVGMYKKVKEARVASFATDTVANFLRKSHTVGLPKDAPLRICQGRDPAWTQELADKGADLQRLEWRVLRSLVRERLVSKPTTDTYYLGMIEGFSYGPGGVPLCQEGLTNDPELLDHEIWRLFEIEGTTEVSLANADRWAKGEGWGGTFQQLVADGKINRDRVLDACLSALQLGFNDYQARWFSTLFDDLEPTDLEIVERCGALRRLPASPSKNVAKWGLGKLAVLQKQGALVGDTSLVEDLQPLLRAEAKGTVKQVLSLLGKLGRQDDLDAEVAVAATDALAHEQVDAQAAAWKLVIRSEPSAELVEAVQRSRSIIAPTLRADVDTWLESNDPSAAGDPSEQNESVDQPIIVDRSALERFSQAELERAAIPALINTIDRDEFQLPSMGFDGTDVPRLRSSDRLQPIDDLDTLVATVARVLEDPSLVDELELALDGIARLHGERPADFGDRTSPLRKRAGQLGPTAKWPHSEKGTALGGLVMVLEAWLSDEVPAEFEVRVQSGLTFLRQRCHVLAHRVADGSSRGLLSAPTHRGGWIEATTFVDRVNATSKRPDPFDLNLALLRLAPDNRSEALSRLKRRRNEWVRAGAYTLGAKAQPGSDAALWVTASRARAPWAEDDAVAAAFPGLGPDTAGPAHFTIEINDSPRLQPHWTLNGPSTPPTLHAEMATQLLHAPGRDGVYRGTGWFEHAADVTWLATIWPGAKEAFFTLGTKGLASNLDWDEAVWANARYLDPLLDPDTPLLRAGLRLLALALTAKEPGERGLATDIAIAAIDDGRLGTDNLTEAIARIIRLPIKPPRLAVQLTEVAAMSDLHAHVVYTSILGALSGAPSTLPRGYGKLIELSLQLAAQLGVGVPETGQGFLATITGSSKTAKAARTLLKRNQGPARTDLLMPVVEARLRRLDSWRDQQD